MTLWNSQLFRADARKNGTSEDVIARAIAIAESTIAVNRELPPIFSLRHIAHLVDVDYGFLRAAVSRKLREPYRVFRIGKRPSRNGEQRYRTITVPCAELRKVQGWVSQAILSKVRPHPASVAFSKGDRLIAAAAVHTNSQWLIKLDVSDFFESISERSVYKVFRSLGYQPLVSFELARICTRLGGPSTHASSFRWRSVEGKWASIGCYSVKSIRGLPTVGHLPQGAPTSPMLANLAMIEFDARIVSIAERYGLRYTRYADDIALSTCDKNYTRSRCHRVIREIYSEMSREGLLPNLAKMRITPPGGRKVVLGLTVDGDRPRLPREFKANLRQHLYYLNKSDIGPVHHARARGFDSVSGLRNHLLGLASFAKQIDDEFGRSFTKSLNAIDWPV